MVEVFCGGGDTWWSWYVVVHGNGTWWWYMVMVPGDVTWCYVMLHGGDVMKRYMTLVVDCKQWWCYVEHGCVTYNMLVVHSTIST